MKAGQEGSGAPREPAPVSPAAHLQAVPVLPGQADTETPVTARTLGLCRGAVRGMGIERLAAQQRIRRGSGALRRSCLRRTCLPGCCLRVRAANITGASPSVKVMHTQQGATIAMQQREGWGGQDVRKRVGRGRCGGRESVGSCAPTARRRRHPSRPAWARLAARESGCRRR
jgi:hypothetical protein